MDSNFQNVCLKKTDKRLLEKIAEITGLTQSKILAMYIRTLAEWTLPFQTCSLLFDDSDCLVIRNSNTIHLKISGIEASPNFVHGRRSEHE